MFIKRTFISVLLFTMFMIMAQSISAQLYSAEFSDTSYSVVQTNGNINSTIAQFGIEKSSGDGEITLGGTFPTISLRNLQIGHKGSNELGLDGDIVPFESVTFDLGNSVFDEHWDQVVATTFVTYPTTNLKSMKSSTIDNVLDDVLRLSPLAYSNTKSASTLGFAIKDLETYMPSVLVTEDYDYDSDKNTILKSKAEVGINYDAFIPILVKAIQEQALMIDKLSVQVEDLKAQINQ